MRISTKQLTVAITVVVALIIGATAVMECLIF